MNNTKTSTLSLRVEPEIRNRIVAVARQDRRSISNVIMLCVEAGLQTIEAKVLVDATPAVAVKKGSPLRRKSATGVGTLYATIGDETRVVYGVARVRDVHSPEDGRAASAGSRTNFFLAAVGAALPAAA